MARSPQAGPSHAVDKENQEEPELLPEPLARLSALLDTKPEAALARGDADIRTASLAAAQFVFDRALKTEAAAGRHIAPFLASLAPSAAPRTRSQARAESTTQTNAKTNAKAAPEAEWRATPLDALHVAGGAQDEQVWAQLDLRAGALCAVLGRILEDDGDPDEERPVAMEDAEDEDAMDEDAEDDGGLQAALDKLRAEGSGSDSDEEPGSSELDALLSSESTDGEHSEPEHELALRDPSDEESDSNSDSGDLDLDGSGTAKNKQTGGRKSVLDDGFFSLAAFNAESDAAEARSRSSGRLGDDEDSEEDGDEDVDLFAAVDGDADGDLDDRAFDEEDLEASGELYYKDFFDPPSRRALALQQKQAQQQQKKAKSKAKQKKQGVHSSNSHPDADLEKTAPAAERKRTVQFHDKVRVKPIRPSPLRRRNLLLEKLLKEQGLGAESDSDEEEGDGDDSDEDDGEGAYGKPGKGWGKMDMDLDFDAEGSETEEEDGDSDEEEDAGRATIERLKDDLFAEDEDEASGPNALSTHEIRQADLRAQIAALEAENAAPRAWALAGEAGARARPADALLAEDLEFDRAARPVPAVTAEKVEGLEAVIKRRILENNFDDVERKRPESSGSLAPSRRAAAFEISDQKSQKSLAQLYEDDYTAASSAATGTALEDRDGKLAKEHKELEKLWDAVCYKLDALCNAHFTPKAPTTKITTITNVPAASLESALPTATSAATMLAPEEVAARATARQLVARSEMTPEEKRRARQRGKERHKKRDRVVAAQGKVAQAKPRGVGAVKKEKAKALSAVAKGRGVTVVGKVNGRDANGKGTGKGVGKGMGQVPLDGKRLKL